MCCIINPLHGLCSQEDAVKRDQFVQDPALLRERAEARRATMQHRKGYGDTHTNLNPCLILSLSSATCLTM